MSQRQSLPVAHRVPNAATYRYRTVYALDVTWAEGGVNAITVSHIPALSIEQRDITEPVPEGLHLPHLSTLNTASLFIMRVSMYQ